MSMIKELALKRKHKWTTNIRRYSTLLVFREIQIKTISYLSDWYNFFKSEKKLLKKQELSNTIDRSVNWYNHVGEQVATSGKDDECQ